MAGDRAELRADAPEFRPSPAVPRTKSQPATKPPADGVVLQPSSQRPAEAADRRAKEDKPLEANASQPSDAGAGPSRKAPGGSVKPPIHPEAVPRAAGKRARDTEPVLDAAKAGSQPDATKVAGDELEPKRRKVSDLELEHSSKAALLTQSVLGLQC